MAKTLVAIWAVENQFLSNWDRLGFDLKLGHLETAVGAAAAEMGTGNYDGAVRCIFVAPEYLFRSEQTSVKQLAYKDLETRRKKAIADQTQEVIDGRREVVDEHLWIETPGGDDPTEIQYAGTEAARVKSKLAELSQQHAGILVVPGTVSHKKKAWVVSQKSGLTPAQRALRDLKEHINTVVKAHAKKITPVGFEPLTKLKKSDYEALQAKLNRLNEDIDAYKLAVAQAKSTEELGTKFIAYNTAYVYFKGEKVLSYHKQGELSEVDPSAKNMLFSNGKNKVWTHIHEMMTNTYAVEVCLDTGLSCLQARGEPVDVQIIPAFGQKAEMIGKCFRKLLIFVDGHAHDNPPMVVKKTVNGEAVVQSHKKETAAGYDLLYYSLDGLGL